TEKNRISVPHLCQRFSRKRITCCFDGIMANHGIIKNKFMPIAFCNLLQYLFSAIGNFFTDTISRKNRDFIFLAHFRLADLMFSISVSILHPSSRVFLTSYFLLRPLYLVPCPS